jgi:surface protein|tara:strand:+ start:737 stop:1717 length:981 start_codon:yes stop_codon:yes gene_type:complete
MAELRIGTVLPPIGDMKVGETNVSKICSGSTLVWPPGACAGYTFADKAALQIAVNEWVSNEAQAIINYGQINTWCTGNVTNMTQLFKDKTTFNDDISSWDVSNVTDTQGMFQGATSFNQDIGSWDTSNVTSMSSMFNGATAFNQDINTKQVTVNGVTYTAWDVSSVASMVYMFNNAQSFNQPIGNWDTSGLVGGNLYATFKDAIAFNQDINTKQVTVNGATYTAWDVSTVTNMTYAFNGATAFDQNLDDWEPTGVLTGANMITMFTDSGLTTNNYDLILIGWSALTLKVNVVFGGGPQYSAGTAATARQSIIDNFGWSIPDAGEAP